MTWDEARCRPRRSVGRLMAVVVTLIMIASASAHAQPTVDGVVDALYGAAIAKDKAGDAQGTGVLDLRALHLYADASTLYVAITINGDIATTSWGKYILYIDTTNDTHGATSDAWGRKVSVSDPHKPELSINAWVDQLPFGPQRMQIWAWNAGAWVQTSGVGISAAAIKVTNGTSVLEYAVPRAILGGATTIWVEAFSTGGDGSNAQDTVNAPAEDWNATDWATTATLSVSTPFILASSGRDAGVADAAPPTPDMSLPTPDAALPPKDVGLLSDLHGDLRAHDDVATPTEASVHDGTPPKDSVSSTDAAASPDAGSSRSDFGNAGLDIGGAKPSPSSEGCEVGAGAGAGGATSLVLMALLGLVLRRRYRRRHDL